MYLIVSIIYGVCILTLFVLNIADAAHPCVTTHQEYAQQAGRLYGFLVPCVHMRPISIAAQQFAVRPWRHQTATPVAVAFQQRIESPVNAGESNLSECFARDCLISVRRFSELNSTIN